MEVNVASEEAVWGNRSERVQETEHPWGSKERQRKRSRAKGQEKETHNSDEKSSGSRMVLVLKQLQIRSTGLTPCVRLCFSFLILGQLCETRDVLLRTRH